MGNIFNNRLPRIIAPFWSEKRNDHPRLLFKEIQYSLIRKDATGQGMVYVLSILP